MPISVKRLQESLAGQYDVKRELLMFRGKAHEGVQSASKATGGSEAARGRWPPWDKLWDRPLTRPYKRVQA